MPIALLEQKKYPDCGILIIYDDDTYGQGYGQIKKNLRAPRNDDILKPYITDHDFRSTNVTAAGEATKNIGYILNVFDIHYQKNLEPAPPLHIEFKVSEDVPAGIHEYALVSTHKLVPMSSDGQRHFDLV